ncbi:MAG: DUF898 family protein [Boseongicola sp.]|nr:DUF898 family protein [Boseongicola sp.]MDD9977590.1 DUF898 family protein [Boseongicola sp.]
MLHSTLTTKFIGQRGKLLRMALWMGFLTVITVGIYRFWMKTRLRRYYWSSIRPGGQPLEYVGEPLEKLLGFFIAVVILAFYIGVVNLILMFLSFSLFEGNSVAYFASLAGVVPIWFYARYRARRYVYARTRWRGIRFGVDPGAWGYCWRALVYWFLTIISGTLLWPLMTYRLEKYRWDRTWFGDVQFNQGGRWTMLILGAIPSWIVLGFLVFALVGMYVTEDGDPEALLSIALPASPLLLLTFAWYRVRSFRQLSNTKTAGSIRFDCRISAPRVIWIYSFGYFVTSLIAGALAIGVAFAFVGIMFANIGEAFSLDDFDNLGAPGLGLQAIGFALYFAVFLIWAALQHVFVTLPLWRHYAERIEVLGAEALVNVSQRERDEHREAEGFAEALDLGAAI